MTRHSPTGCLPRIMKTLLLSIAFYAGGAAGEPVKMTFLSPEPDDNLFWGEVMHFMHAVAEDLGVELDVVTSNGRTAYAIKKDGMAIINRNDKPDYILTGYWNEAVETLLEAGQAHDIRFFLFNTPLPPEARRRIGEPRAQYDNWIGHMRPDEVAGGRALIEALVQRARAVEAGNGEAIEIGALTGSEDSAVGNRRETGLQKIVSDDPQLTLNRTLNTSWLRRSASKATSDILEAYPQTTVVWTVADALALGANDVLRDRGLEPGVDVITGGFDWSADGIEAIQRGEMAASIGGHFMEGGWAVLLAYDYHHGHDFAEQPGVSTVTAMHAVTGDNVEAVAALLDNRDWGKADFKRFSKTHNPDLERYDFSLDTLLNALKND